MCRNDIEIPVAVKYAEIIWITDISKLPNSITYYQRVGLYDEHFSVIKQTFPNGESKEEEQGIVSEADLIKILYDVKGREDVTIKARGDFIL